MQKSWRLLFPALIALSAVALYGRYLHSPTFFDDIWLFHQNGLNRIFIAGPAFDIRWLPYFLTAWVDLIFDDKVFAQRVLNLGLHLITAYVLYRLIKRVSQHVAPHVNNDRAALAAAMLFLLHPLAVYTVGYLTQRTILMATLFALLALGTYFEGLVTRKRAYFVFTALFYFLSAFSKEHAVLVPAAAAALTPLAAPMTRQTLREIIFPMSLMLAILVLVVSKVLGVVGQAYEPLVEPFLAERPENESRLTLWLLSVMTQSALYFKYLLLSFVPHPDWMSIDMRPPFADHIAQPKYLFGVAALATYGLAAAYWLVKRGCAGLAGYALLAPLLLFAVEFSAVRLQEPFVLYRTYLWLPLMFFLIPALTNAVPNNIFYPVMLAAALLLAGAANNRLTSFSTEFALWDDAVQKLPHAMASGSARAYNNRAYHHLKSGDVAAAIADCTLALQSNPKYRLAYQIRALAYVKEGNFPRAIQDAQSVAELFPEDLRTKNLLGYVYRAAGQVDEALGYFASACRKGSFTACHELKVTEKQHALK